MKALQVTVWMQCDAQWLCDGSPRPYTASTYEAACDLVAKGWVFGLASATCPECHDEIVRQADEDAKTWGGK